MQWNALLTDRSLPFHWALMQFLLVVAVSSSICLLAVRLFGRFFIQRRKNSEVGERLTMLAGATVSKTVDSGVLLVAATLTAGILVFDVPAFQPVSDTVELFLRLGTTISIAWLLLQIGRGVRKFLDARFDISVEDNLKSRAARTQIAFGEKVFQVTIVILCVAFCIGKFEGGSKFSDGLLASAGVASIVIGLAAQKTLANVLAGFQIAFTSPIRIDDAVVVENEWGWIEEIALTYVVVRVWDRRRLVLPITYFVEKPFQNWTRKSGQILGSVFLEVAHHTPFEPLNDELNRLLDENPLWDRDAKVLQVVEMKERCVQLRALMTARNSPSCWDLRCAVRRGLIEFLVKNHPDCLPSARLSLVDARNSASRPESPDSWIAPAPATADG